MSEGNGPTINRLIQLLDRGSRVLIRVAALFLTAMMMITVADIVLRTFFNIPIFGTFDLVELFLVALVFLALPETFLREDHVVVEVIDHLFRPRAIAVLRVIAGFAGLVFMVVMVVYMVEPALDMVEFDERTLDLSIPKYIHWIPILLGVFCSVFTVAMIFLRDVLRMFEGTAVR